MPFPIRSTARRGYVADTWRHVAAASRRARAGKAMAGRCASIYNCRIRHPIHAFFGRFPT
ncbi:Valyl-tRNA synthetase [Burkholderia sp. AU4i]|nr:Valyl-tRNA synthetase [Burkholderia sp. AU4i]